MPYPKPFSKAEKADMKKKPAAKKAAAKKKKGKK